MKIKMGLPKVILVFLMTGFLLINLTACSGDGPGTGGVSEQYVVSGRVIDESDQGVSGVRLNFSGDMSGYAETQANGSWKATLEGNVIIKPQKLGYNFEPKEEIVLSARSDLDFVAEQIDLRSIEEDFTIGESISHVISPSEEEQRVTYTDGVALIIPGGALQTSQEVIIYSVSDYPDPGEDYQSTELYAIEFGDQQGLARESGELGIEFSIPPELRNNESDISEVIEGLQWNRQEESWDFKPTMIDLEEGTITVFTRDLGFGPRTMMVSPRSVIGYIQHESEKFEKYQTIDSDNFRLRYNTQMTPTADWEFDPEVMAEDLLDILEEAYKIYTEDLGFKEIRSHWLQGGRLLVRLDTKYLESEWSWRTGIIYVSGYQLSREEFSHELAHELFHSIQNSYFYASGMMNRRWWMEATADYAAGFYYGTGKLSPLDVRFFRRPIYQTDHRREYQAAHYLDFLNSYKGIDIKELWDYTATYYRSNVYAQIRSFLGSQGLHSDNTYRDFIRYSFLSTGTAMDQTLWLTSYPETLEAGDKDTSQSFSLYPDGTAALYSLYVLSQEGEDERIIKFEVEQSLSPGQSVELYVTDAANARFSGQPEPAAVLTGGDSQILKVGHGQYVYALFINTSSRAVDIRLDIEDIAETFQIPVQAESHNLAPVHASFTGQIGPEAPRIEPGSSTTLPAVLFHDSENDIYFNDVTITLSRDGEVIQESRISITNDSTVVLDEFFINNFLIHVR